jgi:hypothetical protein
MSIEERREKCEEAAASWGNAKNAKSAKSRNLHDADAAAKDMIEG